jgi:hypothetical protein
VNRAPLHICGHAGSGHEALPEDASGKFQGVGCRIAVDRRRSDAAMALEVSCYKSHKVCFFGWISKYCFPGRINRQDR